MASGTNTAYVRKLVKIVYQKERQIELLKKQLKEKTIKEDSSSWHPQIQHELQATSGKLREVNYQMRGMEHKMKELETLLESEMEKNQELSRQLQLQVRKEKETREKCALKERKLSEVISELESTQSKLKYFQQFENSLSQEVERLQTSLKQIEEQKNYLEDQRKIEQSIKTVSQDGLRRQKELIKQMQKRSQLLIKEQTLKQKIQAQNITLKSRLSAEIEQNKKTIDKMRGQVANLLQEKQMLQAENQRVKANFVKLSSQYNSLRTENDSIKRTLSTKEGQFQLANQTLKDYQEFAFQIYQHIQAAHVKHCCSGRLRSSKKLIRQAEHCASRFESALCKMGQLQLWMNSSAERIEKFLLELQLPSGTLEDISNIAHSFEQQLELVDLTEKLEKEREFDNNQQEVLDNLQKQVDKSEARERSKMVELDEVREVLKVTKEINRELMDEINSKDYMLSECKKVYGQLIGGKASPALLNLKALLHIT